MARNIVLLAVLTGSFFLLHDLADSILKIKRSKTAYRKLILSIDLKKRIFMSGYFSLAMAKRNLMRLCIVTNRLYIIAMSVSVIMIILALFIEKMNDIAFYFLIIQIIILVLPLYIYSLLNSKHLKNGGVTWNFLKQ